MTNRDALSLTFTAIDTMNTARNHANSCREEMGDQWADELIEWHTARTITTIDEYLGGRPQNEFHADLRVNLLRRAGLA